ncbi:hypothetical protein Syun_027668 [Stephania yunnanensis]|uniref:Uncharacterized protein n=1 Tax=Stephania yunnanensis TaxID=152371 RepID=A0AAP0HQ57_9MAGN
MSDVPYSKSSLLVVAMDLLEPQLQLPLPYLNLQFIFYDFAFYLPKIAREFDAKSAFFAVVNPLATSFLLPNHVIEKGLELTGLPFLVALNAPIGVETIDEALPDGFKEKVKSSGVVHRGWIQQRVILGHGSIGCFVSHCRYGSMWEGLVLSDVQMVVLPQIPNQFLNAQLLSREFRVGVVMERREEDGWLSGESV